MTKPIQAVQDTVVDAIEKCSSPTSRAGHAAERVGKMLKDGISPKVIALQMTETSPTGQKYGTAEVLAYGKLYEDARSGQPITAKQTRALRADMREQKRLGDNGLAHA